MMRVRGIIKTVVVFLASLTGFLLLVFAVINLPYSHRFLTSKVNKIFTSSGLPVHINTVNKVFPWAVYVQGVLISGSQGDTIVYAGKLKTGLKPLGLLRKKVILKSVMLDNAKVLFLRNPGEEQLNIAAAFSQGGEDAPADTTETKSPWEVSVSDAEVVGLSFCMTDSVAAIYFTLDVRRLRIVMEKMSLIEKTIRARSLEIENATGTLTLNNQSSAGETDSEVPWNFGLGELDANDLNFVYDDPAGKMRLDLLAGGMKMRGGNTDLNGKVIEFENISVSRTNVEIRMDNQPGNEESESKSNPAQFLWNIRGDKIDLQDIACRIANYTEATEFNPLTDLSVLGLGMRISDLQLDSAIANAGIENLKFDLGNGFSLMDLDGNFSSRSGKTQVDMDLETSGSRLTVTGNVEGNIFDIINKPTEIPNASLKVEKSWVSLNDVLCFKPDLKKIPGLSSIVSVPLNINGVILLENSTITLPVFSISQDNAIRISVTGSVSNVYEPQNMLCGLKVRIDDINHQWLGKVITDLSPGFSLPDFKFLAIDGSLSDTLMAPGFTLMVRSDLGKINLAGSFDFHHDIFSVKSHFDDILLGKILNNPDIGRLSGSASADGGGIKSKELYAEAVIRVDSAGFMGYDYTNANITGSVSPGKYKLLLNIDDRSVRIKLTAGADITGKEISGGMEGEFLADLCSLHLFKDTLNVKGKLAANILRKKDKLEGDVSLSGLYLATPSDSAEVKMIKASLKSDSLKTEITASSDFFSGVGRTDKSSGSVGSFLKSYISYLGELVDPAKADSLKKIPDLPVMSGNLNVTYHKVFNIFIPDSSLYFKQLLLSVNSDVGKKTISYQARGSGVRYGTLEMGSLNASLVDSSSTLDLSIQADTLLIARQQLKRVRILSHFSDWKSMTTLSVTDKQGKLNYNFNIRSAIDSSSIILTIPTGLLTLNGVTWNIDSPEFLSIDLKTRSFSPSVRMHADSSSISFLKTETNGWKNYILKLNSVALSSFFKPELIPGNPQLSISGSASFASSESEGGKLTTDLYFSDVKWHDLMYNKISVNSSFLSDTTGNFDFEIDTRLDTSEIIISGNKRDKANRNINCRFSLIPVNTIQPFVIKYLSDLKGNISGEFNLSTKGEINDFSGDLNISNGNMRINTLNSSYRLPDEKIKFTKKRMVLSNFRVLDSLNNVLMVEGFIDFSAKKQISADLEISSSNLQILNRKEDKNATFYGDVFIDSKLTIKGPVASPMLKGKIILAKGTDIYFRQAEDLNLSESGTVLTFVSNKPSGDPSEMKNISSQSLYNKTSVESIVEIDPSTRINIELSKKMFNIDMTIKGGGELTYNMLENSQVNMNGSYEISEGGANLKMVGWPNKAFRLTKGGFIRWDGKLDEPNLNLEAVSTIKSSYVNPVDNKERYVDFDVTLKIANRLSTMDVLFTISTPDQYLMSIINTMSPEEQMRQAITILLFQYIDLPGISTSSTYVSEQVNQMVASQLNQLTKTTIKGVDISFGIDTYTQGTASGGEQTKTSLSYEVKRNLMNDRAKVEFSGIVSDASNQSHSSNTSLNNFSFEYRIDSAATKFLKVYNEHSYEDVFEGDVIKTGIGFTYRRRYPSIGDIWKREDKIIKPNGSDK